MVSKRQIQSILGRFETREPHIRKCLLTAINLPADKVDPLKYYSQLREYVQHEDTLINFRLTWLLTINAFLFAAFALAFQKMIDVSTESFERLLHATVDPAVVGLFGFQLLLIAFGVFVSWMSWRAIKAATDAINHIRRIAISSPVLSLTQPPIELQQYTMLLPQVIGGGARKQFFCGGQDYYRRLPLGLALVWLLLLALSGRVFVQYIETPNFKTPNVVIKNAVDAIARLRKGLKPNEHLLGIDTIELLKGASTTTSLDDQVWLIRACIHDDTLRPRHRDYKVDEFLRAAELAHDSGPRAIRVQRADARCVP